MHKTDVREELELPGDVISNGLPTVSKVKHRRGKVG